MTKTQDFYQKYLKYLDKYIALKNHLYNLPENQTRCQLRGGSHIENIRTIYQNPDDKTWKLDHSKPNIRYKIDNSGNTWFYQLPKNKKDKEMEKWMITKSGDKWTINQDYTCSMTDSSHNTWQYTVDGDVLLNGESIYRSDHIPKCQEVNCQTPPFLSPFLPPVLPIDIQGYNPLETMPNDNSPWFLEIDPKDPKVGDLVDEREKEMIQLPDHQMLVEIPPLYPGAVGVKRYEVTEKKPGDAKL